MTDQELNEAVARKLGWKYIGESGTEHILAYLRWQAPDGHKESIVDPYSTSIEAAWEIVEKLKQEGVVTLTVTGTMGCSCQFKGEEFLANTAPRAICDAFLKLNV